MKIKSLMLVLLLIFFSAPLFSDRKALIIGIDNYLLNNKYGGKIDLIGCTNDALDLKKLLVERFDFKEDEIRVLLNKSATRASILEGLRWLVENTKPQDWVFFSFSGHGTQIADKDGDEDDGKDEGICPTDIDPLTRSNIISDDEINEYIEKLKDRRAFFLFDSCHSGTMKRGIPSGESPAQNVCYFARLLPPAHLLKEETQYRGDRKSRFYAEQMKDERLGVDFAQGEGEVVVFSASAPYQLALPVNISTPHPNGAMTYAVLRGLEGVADQNGDEVITYRELLEFSRESTDETISERYKKIFGIEQEPQIDAEPDKMDKPIFFLTPQAELSSLINTASSFKVNLIPHESTSNRIKLGEHISFRVESGKSGYLYLFATSPDGEVTCLLPNLYQKDNYIREKEAAVIPSPEAGFSVEAVEPPGKIKILAIVTTRYLDLDRFCGRKEKELLHTLGSEELKELVRKTRGINGILPPTEWAATVIELEIVR